VVIRLSLNAKTRIQIRINTPVAVMSHAAASAPVKMQNAAIRARIVGERAVSDSYNQTRFISTCRLVLTGFYGQSFNKEWFDL
jgi:hypothetical protein